MSPYNIFDGNPIFYVDPSGADSDGPGDPTKEEIAKHKEKGEVWDTNVNTWVIGDVVIEAKQPQIMKDMKALGYTNRDRWEYAQMQRRSPNNPIVRNIQTRVAEGRYVPIYHANSQYQDFGSGWNKGIYASDYAQGVSSVVGTTGTVAVLAGPGVAIAAGAMSRGEAKEVLDEVVDMAWESYTGTPSPFITSFADFAQAGVRRGTKKLSFYSIQGPNSTPRLATGGEPWPTGPTKAHLGPGIYTWGDEATAIGYRNLLKGFERFENVDLHLLKFDISTRDYNLLTRFDLPLDDVAANKWLDKYSLLHNDKPLSHGFLHITTNRGHGKEYYFSSTIFHKFKMTKLD